VRRESRAEDDGYRCALVPGLRSSADAQRLAEEIAFATARLLALERRPPGIYAEIKALADLEQATWMCFITSYLCPGQGDDPFAGIRLALSRSGDWRTGEVPDLAGVPLGPRTSHEPEHGSQTLTAYRRWVQRFGSQVGALSGELSWDPHTRFARVFERLALPGLKRAARFDLLFTLGALGLYEMRPGSLELLAAGRSAASDPTVIAAKRILGIGETQLLERRIAALAQAAGIPVGVLDLAFTNWLAPTRITLAMPADCTEQPTLERALSALAL
jgi:Alpha-glutamyl/putrescinyl thymine pyrophosphorylase clade 3